MIKGNLFVRNKFVKEFLMGDIEQKKYLQKRYIIEVKLNVKKYKIPFNPVKRRNT